jgi:ATP-dependent exoDNAse (exonuclease V) beta subunit
MIFPTNKPHISYSEVKTWRDCPYRHKLLYIDKLGIFEDSVYTSFGTAVHAGAEKFLKTREIDIAMVHQMIDESWQKYNFDDKDVIQKNIDSAANSGWKFKHSPVDEWKRWATVILNDLSDFMDENFNDWTYIAAEDELYENIEGDELKFKGFIDGIIGDVTKTGKKRIWIIDWKTAGAGGWRRDKKQDFLVQAQLAAYKIYWARREKIDLKDVQCAFVLLKRNAKPGKSISMVRVSVGPKMVQKTEKLVSSMIKTVRRKMFLKNRNSCKFCEFKNTEHCK